MATPTIIRRELLNVASFNFIPVGETILSTTLAQNTWPTLAAMVVSNSLVAGVLAYKHTDVETLELKREYVKDAFIIPLDSGGYTEDEESILKTVTYKGETAVTSSYFKMLELGLSAVPTIGATALTPFVNNNDYIEGLSVIEFRNKLGVITERIFIWSRLRLEGDTKTDPKTRKVGFTIEKRPSTLNMTTLVA
jgi:hypothetical protein